LVALLCLKEYRLLIKGADYNTILYTNYFVLLTILKGDDAIGRITRWQIRLLEYNLVIRYILGKSLVIVDGLLQIRGGLSYILPLDKEIIPFLVLCLEIE
jgi:hypothetical protein